jgi:L-aspartate oxidase
MFDYDERGELAPRDVVAQAVVSQMEATRYSHVYLDLSSLDPEKVHKRFPGIAAACAEFGIDIARDRVPVRPGAHYMVGGVTVDQDGRTTLDGLWAAGEVSATGLHGANRLASNSLLEAVVYGAHAGAGASQAAAEIPDHFCGLAIENMPLKRPGQLIDLADIRNSLKSLMWHTGAVRREQRPLEDATDKIALWCQYILPRQFTTPDGWELQNMLVIAQLMIDSALKREESRGVHFRVDFPELDDTHWCRHLVCRRKE